MEIKPIKTRFRTYFHGDYGANDKLGECSEL